MIEFLGDGDVRVEGETISLAAREYALLRFLANSPGKIFSKKEILDSLWGGSDFITHGTVNVHVCWIRGKLKMPRIIMTVRSEGFLFNSSYQGE